MSRLYLTQEALMILAQLFVVLLCLFAFWRIRHKSPLTRQMTGIVVGTAFAGTLLFYNLLLPYPNPHVETQKLTQWLKTLL